MGKVVILAWEFGAIAVTVLLALGVGRNKKADLNPVVWIAVAVAWPLIAMYMVKSCLLSLIHTKKKEA